MKKIFSVVIILILLALAISMFFTFPIIREASIKSEIKKANYCDVASDCVDAGGKCPFGCWVYVNKDEVNRIAGLIESFDSKCVYGCLSCPTAICEDHVCKPVCE